MQKGHKTQTPQLIPDIQVCVLYVIKKIMCPPAHHHNVFVATHTWAHDVQLHIADAIEPKNAQQGNLLHLSRVLNKHILHPSYFCEI